MSVVAKDIVISVENISQGPLSGLQISKVFGDMWKKKTDRIYEVQLPYLVSGTEKGYVMELNLPPTKARVSDK